MFKRSLTLFVFILLVLSIKSQIPLEKEYSGSVLFAYLEGNAYYTAEYTNNKVLIYGIDYSLLKTINLTPPANMYLYEVAFVSNHVFNVDDLIEFVAVYYNYTPLTDTSGYYFYTTQVVNENGTVLLNIPDGGYSDLISYNDGALKLMVYLYDFSTSVYATNTEVYGLSGTLPSSTPENANISLQNPYPNPANNFVNIPYKLDKDIPAELILVDITGHELNRINLSSSSDNLLLNTTNLKSGQYIYFIEISGRRMLAKKIVVK